MPKTALQNQTSCRDCKKASARRFRTSPNTCQRSDTPASQAAFYNEAVQTPPRLFQRLSLGMVVLLMGLLSIGPFLHSHVGASSVSGFHLDGVRGLTHTHSADAHDSTASSCLSLSEDESPARVVATSLPNSQPDNLCVGDLTAVLAAVLLASLVCLPQRTRRAWVTAAPARTYQAGWPPPALAPPHLNP